MNGALGIHLAVSEGRVSPAITSATAVPVATMMIGRAPEEVAALMPRLFNLCGVAQGLAARLALGLPHEGGGDLGREILRDHLAKLCLHWPHLLGLAPAPLPEGWSAGGAPLVTAVWGGARPTHAADWLASGRGVAPVLAALAASFAPGEAVAQVPALTAPLSVTAQENSPAGRSADDPLMAQIARDFGRGPLWRAFGRLVDLARMAEAPPQADLIAAGTALVPAARGTYALTAHQTDGRVTAFGRVTPTDHLTAPGGALEQSLARLPAAKLSLARLVVDILDPCVPVEIAEVSHA
ncbi:hypothetical protein O5O51_09630 [Sinirhodobacter sp. HNIBRBA609]|nr:hypothetical protein O5O51_09630 [Sinirhodobacter sp. HNIBRBA609]